ncbi:hypothetical protein WJX79_008089 [Trebouxia sp. C0005]
MAADANYAARPLNGWTTAVLLAVLLAQTQTAESQLAFDWGRPCTLVGTAAAGEILPSCGKCGSGAMASNATKTSCTFKDIVIPASSSIAFAYNGATHHLFMASTPCTYTTEICAAKNASDFTTATPCTYTFPASGVFYVSDKTKHYCEDYSAHLKVTIT